MAESSNPATWFRTFGRSKSNLQPTTSTTNPSPIREPIATTHHGDHPPHIPTTPTPDGSPSRLRTRPAAAVRRVSSLFSLVGGSNHSSSSPKRESLFPTHALPGRAAPMGALPLGGFHSASSSLDHGGPGLQDMMGGMGVGGRRGEEQSIVWSSPNMMQMVETLRGVMMGVMRMPGGGGMDMGSEMRDWRGNRGSKGDREVEWETERKERERMERERGGLGMRMTAGRERGGLPVE
ncbi:hypothetical protein QBC40DRAFT_184944 [Triangularia verruculosa]|uniref:Uncharacterized protein n=1 Tax=Triangularia verruculosa TaxID=2587418 RepID=A0AAN7AQU6_9PEZI|nr:hypothetical protein QBC40DRAFT_184944 [Triangularia verruculosa]